MKKYNYFQTIFMSFYSKSLYQDIARNWLGTGFLYIFLLLVLTWIPFIFYTHMAANKFIRGDGKFIVEQIPTLQIKNGQAITPENKPYYIWTTPQKKTLLAIIDTSGKYTDVLQTDAAILMTNKTMFIRQKDNQVNQFDFDKFSDRVVTKEKMYAYMNDVKRWGVVFGYVAAVIISFIYRMIQAVIYAAIGVLIIAKIQNSKLSYQQVLRLAAVIITPAVIISTILGLTNISFKYEFLCYFILSMIYLSYAMHVNKEINVDNPLEQDKQTYSV